MASAYLIEALNELATLLEKTGKYYYDTVNEKRWVLGPGGASGNCEGCEGNADLDWIGDDDLFTEGDEDVDGPPLHPHCECAMEMRERRVRVYV